GCPHLARHRAGHLCRQPEARANLRVGAFLQSHLVTHLAMRERIATHVVERVPIRQLGRPQGAKLLWCREQFEFGGQDLLHTGSIAYLHQKCQYPLLMKIRPPTSGDAFLPTPTGGSFLPRFWSKKVQLAEQGLSVPARRSPPLTVLPAGRSRS